MAKYVDIIGNTVAEATQRGLNDLDLTLDEVTTKVLTYPKKGFFGFGACKAKVRLTVNEIEEVKPLIKQKEIKIESNIAKTVKIPINNTEKALKSEIAKNVIENVAKNEMPTTTVKNKPDLNEIKAKEFIDEMPIIEIKHKINLNEIEIKAKEFIDELLIKMGINGEALIVELDDVNININITGEGMGNVIGRRGDSLDSIQYITNLVIKNSFETQVRVRIDCENYRVKREQTLEKLALKMGHKVMKYKKNMTLEPMNPYERRVIHEVLQNFRGVTTYSTGKEPNRRVVIGYGEKTEK